MLRIFGYRQIEENVKEILCDIKERGEETGAGGGGQVQDQDCQAEASDKGEKGKR